MNLDLLVAIPGCKVVKLLSTYLGIQLSAPFKSQLILDSVEEKFHQLDERCNIYLREGNLH